MASIEKRKWTTPKGEQKTGWRVRWRDGDKQESKTFAKQSDAKAWKARIETDKVEGIVRPKIIVKTVNAVIDDYLRAMEDKKNDNRISAGRFKNLDVACRVSIAPFLGRKPIAAVSAIHVEEWYARLVREKGLAPATAKGRVLEFKLLCAFAVRRKHLAVNPVIDALAELGAIRSTPIRTFTLPQVQSVLAAAEKRAPHQHVRTYLVLRCAVHLAAFCGLRLGEIMGLPRHRINFADGVIEVRHSLTPFDVLKGPKTKSGERDVPMPVHVAAMLRDWLEDGFVPNDRDLTFRGENGRMITWSNFNMYYWRGLLKRAGLDRPGDQLHFHALRHFAASWWIHNGCPLPDTASLMGHSKFDMTLQVYAHAIVGGHRRGDAFENMATRLLPAPASIMPAVPTLP